MTDRPKPPTCNCGHRHGHRVVPYMPDIITCSTCSNQWGTQEYIEALDAEIERLRGELAKAAEGAAHGFPRLKATMKELDEIERLRKVMRRPPMTQVEINVVDTDALAEAAEGRG